MEHIAGATTKELLDDLYRRVSKCPDPDCKVCRQNKTAYNELLARLQATGVSLEQTQEFYRFLQGHPPKGMTVPNKPRLSEREAFSIIWYLQEHLRIIPPNYERCDSCGILYDSNKEGGWVRDKAHCDGCLPAPGGV